MRKTYGEGYTIEAIDLGHNVIFQVTGPDRETFADNYASFESARVACDADRAARTRVKAQRVARINAAILRLDGKKLILKGINRRSGSWTATDRDTQAEVDLGKAAIGSFYPDTEFIRAKLAQREALRAQMAEIEVSLRPAKIDWRGLGYREGRDFAGAVAAVEQQIERVARAQVAAKALEPTSAS